VLLRHIFLSFELLIVPQQGFIRILQERFVPLDNPTHLFRPYYEKNKNKWNKFFLDMRNIFPTKLHPKAKFEVH